MIILWGRMRVARFDRYLLSQLMVFFGFFALILVLVYWTNQAVRLFDQLIADGHSAFVFLEFTALSLPEVIRAVLPIATFVAVVYTTNRLSTESELVVVQATGFSGFRLARPVLVFGIIVGLLTAVLSHFLVPAASRALAVRSAEIAENITARFLTEGSFLHPTDGITFYIREIDQTGKLLDVFLSDSRKPDSQITYTAKTAYLVRHETGPKLVMLDGIAQTLNFNGDRLSTTGFSDFSYDIGTLVNLGKGGRRSSDQMSTMDLLRASPETIEETGATAAVLVYAAHKRFSRSLMAIAAALIGFSSLIVGSFSRFGVSRRIIFAVILLIVVKAIESGVSGFALGNVARWPLVYLAPLTGVGFGCTLLWLSARPAVFDRILFRNRRMA
jgi:lipopolysaccharide export system permease protein